MQTIKTFLPKFIGRHKGAVATINKVLYHKQKNSVLYLFECMCTFTNLNNKTGTKHANASQIQKLAIHEKPFTENRVQSISAIW